MRGPQTIVSQESTPFSLNVRLATSLVVQWLRCCASTAGYWVQSLLGDLNLRVEVLIISYTESINHYNIKKNEKKKKEKKNVCQGNKLLIKENVFWSIPSSPVVKTPPSDTALWFIP